MIVLKSVAKSWNVDICAGPFAMSAEMDVNHVLCGLRKPYHADILLACNVVMMKHCLNAWRNARKLCQVVLMVAQDYVGKAVRDFNAKLPFHP